MSDLYSVLSEVKINKVNITPGIEAIFDNEDTESIASAKKVISLLLNVLLPYKLIKTDAGEFVSDAQDRTQGNQEEWMDDEINKRLGATTPAVRAPGLRFEIPVQALVALHVIQGFHDNNGWYRASYVPDSDMYGNEGRINFKLLGRATTIQAEKAFDDDDTELSRL